MLFLQKVISVTYYAKQKHLGCKKSARPIRSSIANRYVRSKTLISFEAKKLLIKNHANLAEIHEEMSELLDKQVNV